VPFWIIRIGVIQIFDLWGTSNLPKVSQEMVGVVHLMQIYITITKSKTITITVITTTTITRVILLITKK
jgi:hypothetical protein